jgi:hypothetical protein
MLDPAVRAELLTIIKTIMASPAIQQDLEIAGESMMSYIEEIFNKYEIKPDSLYQKIKNKIKGVFKMTTTTADIRTTAELELMQTAFSAILNHSASTDVKNSVLTVLLNAGLTYLESQVSNTNS